MARKKQLEVAGGALPTEASASDGSTNGAINGVSADATVIEAAIAKIEAIKAMPGPIYRAGRNPANALAQEGDDSDHDLFEVSLDGGQTWTETTAEAAHVAQSDTSDVPPVAPSVAPEAQPLPELRSFAPDGSVWARSTDGGQTWMPTRVALDAAEAAKRPQVRGFTRRITALIAEHSPVTDKRIAIPFSAMMPANILAGWSDYQTLMSLPENSLHAIVIPFSLGMQKEHYEALRTVAPKLFLDLPAPLALDEAALEALHGALAHVDVVTVPTELLANKIRSYHATVFAVPDMIDLSIWRSFERKPKLTVDHPGAHPAFDTRHEVVIGAPPVGACGEAIEHALAWITERFEGRVRVERFDWTALRPADEPTAYREFDVVIVRSPTVKIQTSNAPVLPAMAAGCTVVGDAHFRLLRHRHDGLLVGRDTADAWRDTLRIAVQDSRARALMGRNARMNVRRHSPQAQLNKLLLPYRLAIAEDAPVYYDFPAFA